MSRMAPVRGVPWHLMALRKMVDRLRTPVEELDRRALESFCSDLGCVPLDEVESRTRVRAAGEVRTVRIVPRSGADAVEAIISDGRGSITAVFLGRRRIAGITPGRKLVVEGMATDDGDQTAIFNPEYELLD